jgi:hypothetical protein
VRDGRRAAALLLVLLAGALCAPASVHADGDPASDVLIKERVFFPYQIKLPAESVKALTETIAKAKEKGYSVRVALIAHDFDLGSAGLLYRQPKVYAKFLAQELAMFNSDWVLVVMPNGYGVYNCVPLKRPGGYSDPCEKAEPTGADDKVLASLPTQERSKQDFAAAGEVAVRRLAELHGASFGIGVVKPLIAVVAVLAVGAGALALLRRRRRSPAAAPLEPEPSA